jgi:hypothetical protein
VVESPDTPVNHLAGVNADWAKLRYTLKTWREATPGIQDWMERGDFVIDCWNDYWAGPDGQVHSS